MFELFEKKLFSPEQVAYPKCRVTKPAKIYQEKDFLRGTEGYLLTSFGCFPTIAQWTLYMLDLRLSHFVCELSYLISKLWSFAKVECLHLSSSKLRFGTEDFRMSCWVLRVFFFFFSFNWDFVMPSRSGPAYFNSVKIKFLFFLHTLR